MTTTFKLANPDLLEAELTIRASVTDFKSLKIKLLATKAEYNHWPLSTFVRQIEELIEAAEKLFESSADPGTGLQTPVIKFTGGGSGTGARADDEVPF